MNDLIDYSKMTGGEFISSIAALLMTSTYSLPDLDNCIIFAVVHNGNIHTLQTISIEDVEPDAEIGVGVSDRAADSSDDLAVRLIGVADAEHAARAVLALSAIVEAVERGGVHMANVYMTPKIAAGQPWTELSTQEHGTLPDPAMTAPALAAIVDGHGPLPDPEEIARTFAEISTVDTDPAHRERLDNPGRFATETLAATRKLISEYARTFTPDWSDDWTDGGVIGADYAAEQRARLLADTADELAARIGVLAEVSGSGRDALLGLALLDIPSTARIYSHIANQLEGMARSHMLTLAGVLFHVDGRPYHAREALYRSGVAALDESGSLSQNMPVMARALLAAARADVETETARRFLAVGPVAARRFGIDTPDYDLYPAE